MSVRSVVEIILSASKQNVERRVGGDLEILSVRICRSKRRKKRRGTCLIGDLILVIAIRHVGDEGGRGGVCDARCDDDSCKRRPNGRQNVVDQRGKRKKENEAKRPVLMPRAAAASSNVPQTRG